MCFIPVMVQFSKHKDLVRYAKETKFEEKIKERSKHYSHNKEFVQSFGEKKVMEYLEENGIFYNYDTPLMLMNNSGRKQRVRPDFYLYKQKTVIEYCGMDSEEYNKNMIMKQRLYVMNDIKLIIIRPKDIKKLDQLLCNLAK